jgi:hypothetical protein
MDIFTTASLDCWLTTPPEPSDILGVDYMLHCSNACGAFLPVKPDSFGSETTLLPCPGYPNEGSFEVDCELQDQEHGPHYGIFEWGCCTLYFRICRKCGYKNTEVVI